MTTPLQSVRPRSHSQRTTGRATIAAAIAIGLLLAAGASRASDVAARAGATTANEPAPLPHSAGDFRGQLDWLRKLVVESSEMSPQELYDRVAPSVVTITASDKNDEPVYRGSGFFIDKSLLGGRHEKLDSDERFGDVFHSRNGNQPAYVLTNYHVIRPAAHVFAELELSNGDIGLVTHVIAEDEKLDVALLLVTVPEGVLVKGIPLASNDPRVLTTVYAIGSPEGLSGTASEGKVSAYREIFGGDHWLQTTAPISHGSSGGPLLLSDGTLAGMNTLTRTEGQNLNFAIPVSAIRDFLSNGPFQPRDIAEGASVLWHEYQALCELREAAKSARYSDEEKQAITRLVEARLGIDKANKADHPNELYNHVIWQARLTNASLPDEFRYLRYYLIGKASLSAALSAGSNEATVADNIEQDRIRYRESRYAADARDHLLMAIELQPDFSPAHEQLFQHHRASGHWADALLKSDKLVKLMPRCAEALGMRAECYRVIGQPKSARWDLEAAIKLSPANGELRCQLAEVLLEFGEYNESIEAYQKALARKQSPLAFAHKAPDNRDKVHYRLGIAYRKAGNVEKALTAFTTAKALGWSADVCDQQIAECRQRLDSAPVASVAFSPADEQTVYVTKSGTKYHCEDCQHLGHSKLGIELSQATGMYEPCSRCRPTGLGTADTGSVNMAVSQPTSSPD